MVVHLGKVKLKLILCLTKYHSIKTYRRVEVQLHVFVTWALDGDDQSKKEFRNI
jgi:hypothetical protein